MAYCPICGNETYERTGWFNACSAEHICRYCNIKFDWWYEELEEDDEESEVRKDE